MRKPRFSRSALGHRFSPVGRRPWLVLGILSAAGLTLSAVLDAGLPLRLVCGAILIHLLPGIAISRLLRRDDLLQDLVFGLALSPLVVTLIVYAASVLLRLPLVTAIAITGLLTTAALVISTRTHGPANDPTSEWTVAAPLAVSLLLLLLTAVLYFQEPSNMLTIHGLFHCTGVNQVMAGLIPPDNIHLYGHPSGYQWPAWFVPAVSSLVMKASPPLTATVSRFCTFVGLFGLGYLLARDLGQAPAGRAFSGVLSVLGMNLFGGPLYLLRLASSKGLRQAVFHGSYYPDLPSMFTPGWMAAHLRPRTGSIIITLVKFSFILPGYAAVMVSILGAVRVFFRRERGGYLLIFLGAAGALLIHPILAAVLALPFPLALALTQFFRRRGERLPLAGLIGIALMLGLAAMAALPYLLPGMRTVGGGGVDLRIELAITLAMFWHYLPLLLPVAPAMVLAVRERDKPGIFLFLLAALTALFILLLQVLCDWYHLFLMAIPLGLLAGGQLGRWFHRLRSKPRRVALAAILGILVLLGPLLRLHAYTASRRPDADRYRFIGSPTLTLRDSGSDLALACNWIRRNTPPDTVLVERPKERNFEELSSLTGRRIYVGKPTPHTPPATKGRNPMQQAMRRTRRLLQPGTDKKRLLEKLAVLPDPVYVVLSRSDGRQVFPLLVEEYSALPGYLRLDFDRPTVKIYRVVSP